MDHTLCALILLQLCHRHPFVRRRTVYRINPLVASLTVSYLYFEELFPADPKFYQSLICLMCLFLQLQYCMGHTLYPLILLQLCHQHPFVRRTVYRMNPLLVSLTVSFHCCSAIRQSGSERSRSSALPAHGCAARVRAI